MGTRRRGPRARGIVAEDLDANKAVRGRLDRHSWRRHVSRQSVGPVTCSLDTRPLLGPYGVRTPKGLPFSKAEIINELLFDCIARSW